MGVYGNLLVAFPELMRPIKVWSTDESNARTITGAYITSAGDKLTRMKFGNRGTALDYKSDEYLFTTKGKVNVGDYFRDPNDGDICRVVGKADFAYEGGFVAYTTERVTGVTADHSEPLTIKEPCFD